MQGHEKEKSHSLCSPHERIKRTSEASPVLGFKPARNVSPQLSQGQKEMRQIAFSGMWCDPKDIVKDGQFKIRGTISTQMKDHPPIHRYEHFGSTMERDARFGVLMKQLDDSFWV